MRLLSTQRVIASGALTALAMVGGLAHPAHASADGGDGAYGRLDADIMLSVGLGGGVATANSTSTATGAGASASDALLGVALAELRARYLDMVGLVIAPEWRPDETGADAVRVGVALDVRPLFPLRFFLNGEGAGEWLDLLIDSIGVELGTSIVPRDAGSGVALLVGFGLDVPILVPSLFADGLFLHLGARHVSANASDQAAPMGGVSDWLFHATLTFKLGARSGLVAIERPRWRR